MSEDFSEELTFLRLDNKCISFLLTSSKEKHKYIFHSYWLFMLLLESYSLIIGLIESISRGSIEIVWLFKFFLTYFVEFLDSLKFISMHFWMMILLTLQLKLVLGDYLFVKFWINWMISHGTFRSNHSICTIIVIFILRDRRKPNLFIEPDWEYIDTTIYRRAQLACLLIIFHHGICAHILLGIVQYLLWWFIDCKHSKTTRRTFLSIKTLLKMVLANYLI